LTKKFEELAAKYDPMLFFFDTEEQEANSKKLAAIKSVYHSVFEKDANHKVYKRLCTLRQEYPNFTKGIALLFVVLYIEVV